LRRFGALGGIRPITLSEQLAWQGPVAEKTAHYLGEAAAKPMRSLARGCIREVNPFGYPGHQMLGFPVPDSDVPPATGECPQILRIEAQRMRGDQQPMAPAVVFQKEPTLLDDNNATGGLVHDLLRHLLTGRQELAGRRLLRPLQQENAGSAQEAAASSGINLRRVTAPYLRPPGMGDVDGAAPVVPDGMIMSVTRMSFGSISKISLLASLAYSRPFAAGTVAVTLDGS
jgi:hypothetical protein